MFNRIRIALGKGFLDRITIFECKYLFSLYFHIFNTIKQDRFHTHAFHGLAFVIRGGYEEEFINSDGLIQIRVIKPGIRFISRSYNHRLLKSKPNTLSFVIAGPWSKTWTEENDRYIRTLTWGRLVVSQIYKDNSCTNN